MRERLYSLLLNQEHRGFRIENRNRQGQKTYQFQSLNCSLYVANFCYKLCNIDEDKKEHYRDKDKPNLEEKVLQLKKDIS